MPSRITSVSVAYFSAGLILFGALFASFALTGLGIPAPTPEQVEAEAAAAEEAAKPATPPPDVYVPPALEPGRTYHLTHVTPIYPGPSSADPESLPPGGEFKVVRTLEAPPGPWTEISIAEGDRTMYLYGMDLRWKEPKPVYSAEEMLASDREALLRQFRESGAVLRGPSRRLEDAPPPEPEPQEFSEWWAETAAQLGGATQANLIVSGAAAGLTTALTLGAIALLSLFRRQHSWSRPMDHARVSDPIEEEDLYALAQGQGDPDEYDDEDHRRA